MFLLQICCSRLCYRVPMCFDCTKVAPKKFKAAYDNSMRQFMSLTWCDIATEMFENLGN